MTARADEVQCDCHWGSAEELALSPTRNSTPTCCTAPGAHPTGATTAPCCAASCRSSRASRPSASAHAYAIGHVGISFERGDWQQWPAERSAAVREFLHAWWAHTLRTPDPAVHDELTSWFARHAPARLRAHGASEELLEDARLLGLPGPVRGADPHWQAVRRRIQAAATPPPAAPAAPPAPEPDRTAAPG
ncbi:hypothetical protein WKI68_24875 [Streptomyces sp. MS1.HAVA.3]|uniref:Uncharacterized protein n=1 Tax=Streptomyces caledonius TaxID=3134107 RepID=A0ABU8U768_9ACTN